MKRLYKKSLLIVAAGVVSLVAFAPQAALAQSIGIGGRPANPDPNNARTKSIFVKTIEPGASASDAVEVMNNTAQPQTVIVYATDSTVSSGGAFACAQANDPVKGAGGWVQLSSSSVEVPANGTTKVPFTITAPKNAEPGEQDACIILQQKKDTTVQSGIGLSFRTGIRVAILIPGNIVKAITPLGLSVQQKDNQIITTPRVKNTGTVSVDATVHTQIESLFGTSITSQDSVFPVLRGEESEWNISANQPFWGGVYKAHYDISYDKSNNFLQQDSKVQQIELVDGQTVYFFVFPVVGALLIELTILAGVGVGIFFLVRKLRRDRQVQSKWTTHKVTTEQLADIAAHHHVSWKLLAQVNSIKAPYHLKAGQVIKVPSQEAHESKRKNKK